MKAELDYSIEQIHQLQTFVLDLQERLELLQKIDHRQHAKRFQKLYLQAAMRVPASDGDGSDATTESEEQGTGSHNEEEPNDS